MRITLGHDYCNLSSGAMHMLNCEYAELHAQRTILQYANTRDLQSHTLSGESGCGTPRSTEGRDLSMQCLRD
jgi:hypothetical protein